MRPVTDVSPPVAVVTVARDPPDAVGPECQGNRFDVHVRTLKVSTITSQTRRSMDSNFRRHTGRRARRFRWNRIRSEKIEIISLEKWNSILLDLRRVIKKLKNSFKMIEKNYLEAINLGEIIGHMRTSLEEEEKGRSMNTGEIFDTKASQVR